MEIAIEHLPASGRPEQLVLLLHGWAQQGLAMAPLAEALRREFPQAAVLAPDAPTPADGGRRGRMWYSIEGLEDAALWRARVAAQLEQLEPWVRAQQQRLAVPQAATCLAGFSQGALLGLELVARQDGIAGRVLAFGGRYCTLPDAAPRFTTLHFLHGRDDAIFTLADVQQAFAHLAERRGDATLDVAHGVGHELHPALIECALQRLRTHIPRRTWEEALGAVPVCPPGRDMH
ncbi:MAG: esterase [Rubrivivax sp. SCN 71-131]|nr:MAG: esterase [Rubrivivax sp. SCN 71-131]